MKKLEITHTLIETPHKFWLFSKPSQIKEYNHFVDGVNTYSRILEVLQKNNKRPENIKEVREAIAQSFAALKTNRGRKLKFTGVVDVDHLINQLVKI